MPKLRDYVTRTRDLVRARPRGWQSMLYNTAMAKAKRVGPLMMPVHISIEPTNVCNLRCPVCETGNGSMQRPRGMLDYDLYTRFIDEVAPHTAVLMYYFMGEPFLNRRAYDMIRYARAKGIYVETCTNGDYIDPEGTIYSDINEISIQIGGMTQQTHEIYRVRGDLARVLRNLERLVEERRRHPGSNVQIDVGFVVMKHNEHEVPEFLRWAKDVGVDRANVIDPCVRTMDEGREMLPEDRRYWFYDEEAFARGVLKPKHLPDNECTWVWNSVMVTWDGSVVPCCRDTHGTNRFGNVFEQPLRAIWNGDAIRTFRSALVSDQRNVSICKLCSGYGVPALNRSRPIDFEVQRMSLDDRALDIPLDEDTIGTRLIQISR